MVVAVLVAAGLAIAAWAYLRDDGLSCRDWQEAWGREPQTKKLAELRPEGCREIDIPG